MGKATWGIILMSNFFAVALACVISKQPQNTLFPRWDNVSQRDKVACLNLYRNYSGYITPTSIFSALPDPQDVDFYGQIPRTFFLWFLVEFSQWGHQQEIRVWEERAILLPPFFGIILEMAVSLRVTTAPSSSPFSVALVLNQVSITPLTLPASLPRSGNG